MKKRRKYLRENFKTNFNFLNSIRNNHKKKLMVKFGKKGGNVRKKTISIQERNNHNSCNAQLKEKFMELYKKSGKLPSYNSFTWARTLVRRYGSYNNAVRSFGFIPNPKK